MKNAVNKKSNEKKIATKTTKKTRVPKTAKKDVSSLGLLDQMTGLAPSFAAGAYVSSGNLFRKNMSDSWQPDYHWLIGQCKDIVHTCQHIEGSFVAKAEPRVYERITQDEWVLIDDLDNAVIRLFEQPQKNTNVSIQMILYKYALNRRSLGNVYLYFKSNENIIHPDTKLPLPEEIFLLPIYANTSMKPIYDKDNNLIEWEYRPDGYGGETTIYKARDILHFELPSLNNSFYGTGTLAANAALLKVKDSLTNYKQRYFDNDAGIGKIYLQEDDWSPEQVEEFAKNLAASRGPWNSNESIFLTGGWKLEDATSNAREADFLETEKFNYNQILGMFQMPPTFVSITETSNRAIDNNSMRNYINNVQDSILKDFNYQISRFIQRRFNRRLFVEFQIKLPMDEKQELEKIRVLGGLGCITINMALKMAGLEKLKLPNGKLDPRGDELITSGASIHPVAPDMTNPSTNADEIKAIINNALRNKL